MHGREDLQLGGTRELRGKHQMAKLSMIDPTKSFTLTASTRGQATDPVMLGLASQMSMPQLLNVDEPTERAEPLSISVTGEFIAWLQSSQWASRLEKDLQCMSEDKAGRPLLTSWLNAAEFAQFVAEAQDSIFGQCLQKSYDAWIALGMDTVYFDGYKVNSQAVA